MFYNSSFYLSIFLGKKDIQVKDHSSKEDALATMALYKTVEEEWEADVQTGKYKYGEKKKKIKSKGWKLELI